MGHTASTKDKTAIIIASRPVTAGMRRYVRPGDFVIAADAGWQRAAELGLAPQLAVGDFDSSPRPAGIPRVVELPAEKDDTDTYHAARLALEAGYGRVVLLGALGGRRDHHHANLQTMLYLARGGAAVLAADAGFELHCTGPGRQLVLPRENWRWLSVFAAGGPATGVHERGVKYPLANATLSPDTPLGASNEFAGDEAVISCGAGCLYVMLSTEEAGS